MRNTQGIGREFRKPACTVPWYRIHHVRRQDLGVAVLTCVQIEHEVGQGPLQLGPKVPVDGETSSRKLGPTLQVKNAELLSQFPVRLWRKVELRSCAPAAYFDILLGAFSNGDGLVRNVGDAGEQVA